MSTDFSFREKTASMDQIIMPFEIKLIVYMTY